MELVIVLSTGIGGGLVSTHLQSHAEKPGGTKRPAGFCDAPELFEEEM